MIAIWKREFAGYFTTPIGFIYLGIFYIFSGLFFYLDGLLLQYANVSGLFLAMFSVLMYLLPILTMRLFAEDKRLKTDQLLYTAPVSVWGIVLGKILAAFSLFCIASTMLLVYCGVFELYSVSSQDWGIIAACFLGILLLGLTMICIGAFLSVVSENQIIAAVLTFVLALFLNISNSLALIVPWGWLSNFLDGISFATRFTSFTYGIVDLKSILFFISVAFLFYFYCVRIIERRQYID